jgi:hypothetical protein
MPSPKVFLFIDNSNIFISAKTVAESKEGRHAKDNVRISFESILKLAVADRDLGKVYVVGSIPPEQRAVWDRLEHATGVKPELFERGEFSGGEQGLDQCLQVHMLRAISDNPEPQIVVLMTGDGAGYDDGVGFHADMERMWAAGWGVEVITWEASCRRSLREWAKSKGCFIRMEDHYESVTFIESGRRAKPLDLTKRQKATPKLSPAQAAAQKTKESFEKKLAALQAELEATKLKSKGKEIGRAKYEKRVSKAKR